jgi:rhamnosyltransferase
MSKSSDKYITVFIPSYNGGEYTKWCVDAILAQQLPEGYKLDLLVIDSGSRDGSVELLKSYGNKLTLLEIPNSEFSHGGTRDKAAHLAKGEFVLFLSQDATPAHDRWLINMIEPFFLSPRIGCVYGRQRPRPNAAATIKREVAGVFGALGTPDNIIVSRWNSLVDGEQENEHNDFFSDVNSASRRDLLLGEVPYRHIAYAEDQALAQDMQERGYLKAYAPKGEAWHSNEYTWKQYFHRKFDEFIGLHNSTGYHLVASRRSLLLGWIRPTIQDWKFIRRDGEYSLRSKFVWALESPLYNMAAKAGQYMAAKHSHEKARHKRLSLEERGKD